MMQPQEYGRERDRGSNSEGVNRQGEGRVSSGKREGPSVSLDVFGGDFL